MIEYRIPPYSSSPKLGNPVRFVLRVMQEAGGTLHRSVFYFEIIDWCKDIKGLCQQTYLLTFRFLYKNDCEKMVVNGH